MSNKAHRPKMVNPTAKAVLIGARFSGEESKQIELLAKETRQSKSSLLRNSVLASRDVWSSRWKAKQLDRQTVEFWLLSDDSHYRHGHGQFLAIQRGCGSMGLSIESHYEAEPNPEKNLRIYIPQLAVDFIEKAPAGSKGAFLLIDPRLSTLRTELEKQHQ